MPSLLPVVAIIELTFPAIIQVGPWSVRLATVALAIVVFLALVLAVRTARRTPVDVDRPAEDADPPSEDANRLRADDLLFIAVAALPGAVAGGRIGYVLLHADFYGSHQAAILDPGQGAFQLSLAVVGGTITGAFVASLLGGPVGRWLHALILPLLLGIGLGKLAMVLGGQGQGLPWDGAWATAYLGTGPWLSLAPAVPSHPAQAYEGLATLAVFAVLAAVLARGGFGRMSGAAFLVGLAAWSLARLAVGFTWRDPAVLGPLSMDQVLSLLVAAGALGLLVLTAALDRRRRRAAPDAPEGAAPVLLSAPGRTVRGAVAEPEWPDPETRPRI